MFYANPANKVQNIATHVPSAVINVQSYLLQVQLLPNPVVEYLQGQSRQSHKGEQSALRYKASEPISHYGLLTV